MPRRQQLIDQRIVGDDGKVLTVRAAAPRADLAPSAVPSSVTVSSAAGTDDIAGQVADALLTGDDVCRGDLLTVRFVVGPTVTLRPGAEEVAPRVTELLGDGATVTPEGVLWDTVLDDQQVIDLHTLSLAVADALGVVGDTSAARPDIRFEVDRYTSEVEDRIGRMSVDAQKALALSTKATRAELATLLVLAPANVQVSALANPRTPTSVVRQVAQSGPLSLIPGRNGTASRANRQVQRAAASELGRRARRNRRG